MFMRSKLAIAALLAVLAAPAQQQNRLNSRSMMHITLPDDSPLAVLSADWGESVATQRGSAILLDLRTSLTLRNIGRQRIKGVSLLVLAQEAAPPHSAGTAAGIIMSLHYTAGVLAPLIAAQLITSVGDILWAMILVSSVPLILYAALVAAVPVGHRC